jgi:hypothetical protein
MESYDVVREIKEISQMLSYSKRIGFFLGAGASAALGIPNISQLTKGIQADLKDKQAASYLKIQKELGENATVEDILNYLRLVRELTKERADRTHQDLSGAEAKALDQKICELIYTVLKEKESTADLSFTKSLVSWIGLLGNDFTKEIYTTNYDLILERSFEASRTPYFDGFVGSFEPFFFPESFESANRFDIPPMTWIRLWKLHGSLNWYWKTTNGNRSIIRQALSQKLENEQNEIVIYPSNDKYSASRKQPFIAYFDRLKTFLQAGELLFIISGYSFSDEHINEIFYGCLRNNARLVVLVFCFDDSVVEKLESRAGSHLNMVVLGPQKAILRGNLGTWNDSSFSGTDDTSYWNTDKKTLTLGDFKALSKFVTRSLPNSKEEAK